MNLPRTFVDLLGYVALSTSEPHLKMWCTIDGGRVKYHVFAANDITARLQPRLLGAKDD